MIHTHHPNNRGTYTISELEVEIRSELHLPFLLTACLATSFKEIDIIKK